MEAWKITRDRFRVFILDAKSQIWPPLSGQTWADFVFKINSFDWTCPNTRVNLTKMQWRLGEDVCGETLQSGQISLPFTCADQVSSTQQL